MGLPTALLLARSEMTVYGYDIDKKKIKGLKKGTLPFEEPGLKELFTAATPHFVPIETLQSSDAFILTLPTPITTEKSCDTSFVLSAVNAVCRELKDDDLVVLESTVAPGTTTGPVQSLLEKTGKRFSLSYVSEKAIPGNTIAEMQTNHRIIGGLDETSAKRTKALYERFVTAPIHLTDCTTAEAVKLLENTYRDVNIALANELAIRLSQAGVNVWEAIRLANFHPRVHLHQPGPGVGGHCIAVDPWFLVSEKTPLIRQARLINDGMPSVVVGRIEEIFHDVHQPTIVLLGVAYKGNVDDDRESPAYTIKDLLEAQGYTVRLYDPLMKNKPLVSTQLSEVTKDADCVVLVTDHLMFKDIDPRHITNMRSKHLFDTRNILNHKAWEDAGFTVHILGK
ncbi:MAG: nucleotide sugar dehydrogenase [Candidatus Thermoplasmatota archaeon]|nr:nucleotide sugar dehydrogenase [Candidatus Thermoplasmatota archaeon]